MLTSDDFEGRLTGSEGNKKAGAYLAEQFRLIGLQPLMKTIIMNTPKEYSTFRSIKARSHYI
jgi:hypothetical protein